MIDPRNTQEKTALIIGGGIAGLLAARALCESYAKVQIIERDSPPDGPGPRAGTPQSFHLHQVLPRGDMTLERFFPGFAADIVAHGAFQLQRDSILQMSNPYGTIPFPGGGEQGGVTYSRSLLEWLLRQRVQALANVSFLYHQEVISLTTTGDGTRVTGVQVRERGQHMQQTLLTADLVVDASGRSSKLPQWLARFGYDLSQDERVTSAIGYSTRYYKIPPQRKNVAVAVIESDPAARNSMGGVLKAIEGDMWMVCLTSVGGQYPPTDGRGFDEGLTQLISPTIAEAVREAEPLGEPRGYRLPECVRHHYELMERWPTGLLVLGDALCAFDPVYGQGMTVAALEAETLAASLHGQQGGVQPGQERQILRRMQDAIYPAWWRSALEDLRWPGVTHSGPQPLKSVELLHRYFDLCMKQSTHKLLKLLQVGEFNPAYMSYFMMNWLFISPRAVINADMLNVLLEGETSEQKQAMLDELLRGYDGPIEAVLDEAVPDFAFDFTL